LATFQDGKLKTLFLFLNSILLLFTLTVIVIYFVVIVIAFIYFVLVVYQVEQDFGIVGRDGQGPPEALDRLLGVAFHPPEVTDLEQNETLNSQPRNVNLS
jgi:hypothetical protein